MAVAEVIALAGKGGTGKTTVAGLVVRSLRRARRTPILAVDADPNVCLDAALGLHPTRTVSDVLHASHGLRGVPETVPKATYLEYELEACLAEGRDVDLIEMGRPEGPACYCSANHLLRTYIDRLMGAYRTVVVDNEAGMEHLSRRTTRDVDLLLIVSDASQVGIRSAQRIRELVTELAIPVRRMALVVNQATELPAGVEMAIAANGLEVAGLVPDDPRILEFELAGRPLLELPDGTPAVGAVERMLAALSPEGGQS
jgi:CO dehydrogenase maturation factor